jgi:Mrp family chromosome partitioning ATPase
MRKDLEGLWREAGHLQGEGGARVLQFIGLHEGEGTTSAAASFALLAAAHVRRTAWLVDLDLRRNPAFEGFQARSFAKLGAPGAAYDAGLACEPIYDITPAAEPAGQAGKLLNAHRVGRSRLLVTRFRTEKLRPGQRIRLTERVEWWMALREATDWVVVDSPALERSRAGLATVKHADAVVIVVHAELSEARDIERVRREVESAGGQVLGVVMNATRSDARLVDRMFGG